MGKLLNEFLKGMIEEIYKVIVERIYGVISEKILIRILKKFLRISLHKPSHVTVLNQIDYKLFHKAKIQPS